MLLSGNVVSKSKSIFSANDLFFPNRTGQNETLPHDHWLKAKFLPVAKCCKVSFVRQKDESALLIVALWVRKDEGKFKSFYRNSIPTISCSINTFYASSLIGVTYGVKQRNHTPNLQCIEVHDQFLENFLPYIFCHWSTTELHKTNFI